jgi:1-aminocyclopropane-1-carboxylate deaminase/D-cysteine desulfhydrase-like pyridoxal-dependent ACC family enzyme
VAELTVLGSDWRRADHSVWAFIVSGWIGEPATVRAKDSVIERTAGRRYRQRVKDIRVVPLTLTLKAATQAGILALQLEIADVLDGTAALGAVVVADGYRGLAAGQTATLSSCYVENAIIKERVIETRVVYSVQIVSIANPPEWVLAGP